MLLDAVRAAECWKVRNKVVLKEFTTYVCVGTLVGSGTGEGDKLVASFVNHKTAHWNKERERERETTVRSSSCIRALKIKQADLLING